MNCAECRPHQTFWKSFWQKRPGGEGAFPSEYPPAVRDFVVNSLQKRLPQKSGRIIDIGAGADLWLSSEIKQTLPACQLTALDIVEVYPGKLPGREEIHFVQASAYDSGLPAASFDAAVSTFTLDYLDRAKVMAEIERLLKPAGFAVLVMHHKNSILAPSFKFEAALLSQQREELALALPEGQTWDRERLNRITLANIYSAELRTTLRAYLAANGTQVPSAASLAPLVRQELQEFDRNISLLTSMRNNLFSEASQVNSFFLGCGFSGEVSTILLRDAHLLSFGVVGKFGDA